MLKKNSKLLLLLIVAEVVSSSVSEENVIGLEHPSATANIKKHDLLNFILSVRFLIANKYLAFTAASIVKQVSS